MSTIQIITLDENGRATVDELGAKKIALPMVGDVLSDRIFMRPDWPQLGMPEFDEQLHQWHTTHNAHLFPQTCKGTDDGNH
jgi:hypothetical protein